MSHNTEKKIEIKAILFKLTKIGSATFKSMKTLFFLYFIQNYTFDVRRYQFHWRCLPRYKHNKIRESREIRLREDLSVVNI